MVTFECDSSINILKFQEWTLVTRPTIFHLIKMLRNVPLHNFIWTGTSRPISHLAIKKTNLNIFRFFVPWVANFAAISSKILWILWFCIYQPMWREYDSSTTCVTMIGHDLHNLSHRLLHQQSNTKKYLLTSAFLKTESPWLAIICYTGFPTLWDES